MRYLTILCLAVMVLAAACGGDDSAARFTATQPPQGTPVATSSAAVSTDPATMPSEFRVAFINLMSPVALDATDSAASDTYDQRLDLIIEELKAFKPDMVGFNEATNTKAHDSAVAKLAKELKMEQQQVRANPWFPNATKEQNDEIAKQSGFEEFEVILARASFPILKADRSWVNPRTSETEGRAVLHVVVKTPTPLNNIDVYITHLTGGGDKVRGAQAASVLGFVNDTRGSGPLLLMGDLSDVSTSAAYKVFVAGGLRDAGSAANLPTCCREKIVGEQPPLTLRTDYFFADRWAAPTLQLWGDKPHARADGTLLYPSDHNGLMAVFPLAAPAP